MPYLRSLLGLRSLRDTIRWEYRVLATLPPPYPYLQPNPGVRDEGGRVRRGRGTSGAGYRCCTSPPHESKPPPPRHVREHDRAGVGDLWLRQASVRKPLVLLLLFVGDAGPSCVAKDDVN